jgi:LysM repeat protein/GH25 family lysozyme M1 (1,4-beta-N-acetylmuramidase)
MEKLNKLIKSVCGLALTTGLAFSFVGASFAQQPNVDFIDVSHHNAEAGLPLAFYQTLKQGDVNAVVIKVSEGEYYVDPAASVNVANAKQAGMIVHAYHFARFTSNASAKAEADWFDKKAQLVGFNKKTDGYVVCDVEATNLSSDPAKLTEYTNTFVSELKSLGYSKIDIYTGSYFYNSRLQPKNLSIDKPWLAAYPYNPQPGQPTANFSNGRGAWQWTSNWTGMAGYGRLDASEDYAGKYTKQVQSSTPNGDVGQIQILSLVDWMKANNMDASFTNRAKLAEQYGITGYTGSSAQNLALLSKLKSGVKPAKVNTDNSPLTTNSPAPAPVQTVKQPTPIVEKPSTYTVKSGDSLSKIAVKYGLTVNTLASINGIKNKNFIRVGQVLKLTGTVAQPAASKAVYYTVKKGDVVSVIAKRYGSTSAQIKTWNKLNSKYTIYPGQKLRIK